MKSASCQYKLLENAYIGVKVRMTGDRSTVPFKNLPMKGVKIVNYNKQGFNITHPDLPRSVWLDFRQLPLTKLCINNGVIEDEITFVENIVAHEMEFIKTDQLDYLELLDIREREKTKNFVTVNDISIGDEVRSALCESGSSMIYLGTFYVKTVDVINNYDYGYRSYPKVTYTYHMDPKSPLRAFFLVKRNNGQYVIKNYPITNKVILSLENLNVHHAAFDDINTREYLMKQGCEQSYIIRSYINRSKDYYVKHDYSNDLSVWVIDGYPMEKNDYYFIDCDYIDAAKEGIDLRAKEYLEQFWNIKLEPWNAKNRR